MVHWPDVMELVAPPQSPSLARNVMKFGSHTPPVTVDDGAAPCAYSKGQRLIKRNGPHICMSAVYLTLHYY